MSMNDSIKSAVRDNVPAVTIEDSLREAIRKMTEAESTALVVKTGDELIGIITEMDLMRGVEENADLDATTAASVMTACDMITKAGAKSPCVQLDEDESAAAALAVMNEAGVHHLLVSGADGRAVGIVSARDLLRLYIS